MSITRRHTLEFPVLVRHVKEDGEKYYTIRPLLFSGLQASDKRFEKAMRSFQQKARRTLQFLTMDRAAMHQVLWYFFNPEYRSTRLEISLEVESSYHTGKYLVVWFYINNDCFVCLPGLDDYMFIVPAENGEKPGRESALARTREIIEKILAQKARESRAQGISWDASRGRALSSDFITEAELDIRLDYEDFPFVVDESSLFYFLSGRPSKMDGRRELELVGEDWNLLYPDELKRAVRRESLVARLQGMLLRSEKTALALVGPRGTGKTTLLQECLFRNIQDSLKPENRVPSMRFWRFDPNRVIAGMSVIGMWQKRFEAILRYIVKARGKNFRVLYTDNLPALFRIGKSSQNSMTLADLLKPYLEKRRLAFVAELTPEEWKKVQEVDRGFTDLFEVLRVDEPTNADSFRMIMKVLADVEQEYGCVVSPQALAESLTLQRAFLGGGAQPGLTANFLKRTAIRRPGASIGRDEILESLARENQLDASLLDRSSRLEPDEPETFLRERLVGQEEALKTIADVVHRVKAGLTDPEKPYGVFLFIGPTGVGKTEAAKCLAEYFFRDREKLLRFDLNEYVDADAPRRLIGDGYGFDGRLTSLARRNPFSVILLDEIEKAHPSVHDLLLQVLGEGRLSDARGRVTDFTRTVIIMTSNLGAREAGRVMGFERTEQALAGAYEKAVREFFRPEFLNRIDRVVPFRKLGLEDAIRITRLELGRLFLRDGFSRRNMLFNIPDVIAMKIAERGFDPELGGRSLKRVLERDLIAPAAEKLAELPAGSPVFFEVRFENDRLNPRVHEIREIEPGENLLPRAAPERETQRNYLLSLLKRARKLRESMDKGPPESDPEQVGENWRFFALRDQADQYIDALKSITNHFDMFFGRPDASARMDELGASPFRRLPRSLPGEEREKLRELYARPGMRAGLSRAYQRSTPLAPQEFQLRVIGFGIEYSFLSFFSSRLLENQYDVVRVIIGSFSPNDSTESLRPEISYLKELYASLLDSYNFPLEHQYVASLSEQSDAEAGEVLEIQGPGARELFAGEEGLHLFFRMDGSARVLRILLEPGKQHATGEEKLARITRLYALREGDEHPVICDFRNNAIGSGTFRELDARLFFHDATRVQTEEKWSD